MRVDWKHEWAHQKLTKEHVYTVHAFVLNTSQFKSKATKGPALAGLGGKGLTILGRLKTEICSIWGLRKDKLVCEIYGTLML